MEIPDQCPGKLNPHVLPCFPVSDPMARRLFALLQE
jgi:hypothetical protein